MTTVTEGLSYLRLQACRFLTYEMQQCYKCKMNIEKGLKGSTALQVYMHAPACVPVSAYPFRGIADTLKVLLAARHTISFQVASERATSGPNKRRYLEEAECNGVTYHVGCSAYVVMDTEASNAEYELEVCEICRKTVKKKGRKEIPMLECDKCLRGYHLDCLNPPLKDVPEVDPSNSSHHSQSPGSDMKLVVT